MLKAGMDFGSTRNKITYWTGGVAADGGAALDVGGASLDVGGASILFYLRFPKVFKFVFNCRLKFKKYNWTLIVQIEVAMSFDIFALCENKNYFHPLTAKAVLIFGWHFKSRKSKTSTSI